MRICASNADPYDYCRECAPDDSDATRAEHTNGLGPDGRGDCYTYDDDHPGYDCDEYHCAECGTILGEDD